MAHRTHLSPGILAIGGAVLVVLAAAAGLYYFSRDDGAAISPRGNTYVEGVTGTWQRINPLFAGANPVDQDLSQLVFAGLTRLSETGVVEADLAQNWDVSSDGRTYTFRLRDDLQWHDGEPLTSADVAFTIAQLQHPDFQGDGALADSWLGVEVSTPDELTVEFRLAQAYSPFLARNTTLGILPEHLLGDLSPAQLYESSFNVEPVGAGPYQLSEVNSEEATLQANDDYHFGPPSVVTVRLRFFADYATALQALEDGELNGIAVKDAGATDSLARLNAIRGATIESPQTGSYLILYLNNARVPFDDQRVRTAFSLALNRESMLTGTYGDSFRASSSAIAPGTWSYVQQYDEIGQDAARATALLEDAGWARNPTTGVLTREGVEFRITLRTDNDPKRIEVANDIVSQLSALGVRVTVASTTFSVLQRDILATRQYDAALALWDQGPDPDPYSAWHSSENGQAGQNYANFADVVVDELIAQARVSPVNDVRRENYRQFQEVWQQLTPSVVIGYPRLTLGHTEDLSTGGFGVLFSSSQRFSTIFRWRI